MKKNTFAVALLVIAMPLIAQAQQAKSPTPPFKVALDSPTACLALKKEYKTIQVSQDSVPEELQIGSPDLHFPDANLIKVFCLQNQIIHLSVRIRKTRNDGADLAALYEELSRAHTLDLVQPDVSKGIIKSDFKAGKIRVELTDDPERDFRLVQYRPPYPAQR